MSTMTLMPCPFCGAKASKHKNPGERWVYFCPNGHTGYLRHAEWQARAHLAQPSQAVDVEAIREVIELLKVWPSTTNKNMADKLTRAIGNAQVEGWRVPEGCLPVPRSLVERWASVDAFNAPVGAAMELKTVAAQMLIHADMITAPPQPEE